MTEMLRGYAAAHQAAAFYLLSDGGCLRLEGSTRLEFLQRQTSNDLRSLTQGGVLATVLTSPTARIQDVFWVLHHGDHLTLVTLPERGAASAAFLRGRIFFNDDVTVTECSSEVVQLDLFGPRLEEACARLGWSLPPEGQFFRQPVGDVVVALYDARGVGSLGWRLLLPRESVEAVCSRLEEAGLTGVDETVYEICRVEAGIPGGRGELTEVYNPLEVGLMEQTVSLSKGCYTGQEVLARQVNYDKITRHLVGLWLSGEVTAGTPVTVEGKTVGEVTSVVSSPRLGWIALGVLKRPHHTAGTAMQVGGTQAIVAALPFDANQKPR